MNWDDLRFVLEVSRTGSVMAASKKLRVAPTTVYRRVQAIEQAHGVQLFEKRGSEYHATDASRALVELAGEVDERLGFLQRQLDGRDVRIEGDVRITTVAALAAELGEPLLAFREIHPLVRLSVTVTDEMVSLASGEVDVAIRFAREPPPWLWGRKLADVSFAVFGAKHALPEVVSDLAELDWICFDSARANTPQGRWEAAHVPPERVVLRTNARALFLDAVRLGMGVGILPRGLGAYDERLRALSDPLEELTLPLWLLTHAELRNAPRIRAVLDFLADALDRSRDRF